MIRILVAIPIWILLVVGCCVGRAAGGQESADAGFDEHSNFIGVSLGDPAVVNLVLGKDLAPTTLTVSGMYGIKIDDIDRSGIQGAASIKRFRAGKNLWAVRAIVQVLKLQELAGFDVQFKRSGGYLSLGYLWGSEGETTLNFEFGALWAF
jgi:hypothetical protein